MNISPHRGFHSPSKWALHSPRVDRFYRGSVRAEASNNEANFFVRDFGREGFLEGLQSVHSRLLAGSSDLVVPLGRHPPGLEFRFASLDQLRDQENNAAQRSLPNLRTLLKRPPLRQQLEVFF